VINKSSDIFIPKGNISDRIIEEIMQRIIRGELKPGDKLLTEMEFCEQLGVSRNVVREAIKALVSLGVVEIRRGEGTFIVNEYTQKLINPIIYGIILTKQNMHDLLEMNICMMHEILKLSKSRMTKEDLANMETRYDALEHSVYAPEADVDEMTAQSTQFYKALVRVTKNPAFIQVYDAILDILTAARRKGFEYVVNAHYRDEWMENYKLIMKYLRGEPLRASEICDSIFTKWDECLS